MSDGRFRRRLNFVAKLCRKSHRTHHPQGVLPEAFLRITYAADDPVFHILSSVKNINEACFAIVRHGIHGKIPAL